MTTCECGCGQDAGVYIKTRRAHGHIAGEPRRFAPRHNLRARRVTPPPTGEPPLCACGCSRRTKDASVHYIWGHGRPPADRARIWLEEWDFLRGQVRFRHFHKKIGTDASTWRQVFYEAARKGDPRAVKSRQDELDELE